MVKAYDFSLSVEPEGDCTPTTYEYDTTYPDRLISFNGNTIAYNAQGYPTLYKGKFFSWSRGKLNRIYRGSSTQVGYAHEDCTFTHNAYGQRTSKSYVYDVSFGDSGDGSYSYDTTYQYDQSGRLIREHLTERNNDGSPITREFIYLYDETGMIGVMYGVNGSTAQPYYYHRNLQGDVIAIYDARGEKKVEYAYDAWGNCTIVYAEDLGFAKANPIRYRSYYFDRETGLYYLNARYYNPEWRRFISPDAAEYIDPETPNGLNLYVYCYNDPVNYADPSGHFALTAFGIWAIVGIVSAAMLLGGGAQLASNALAGETGSDLWRGVAGAALGTGANALALCLLPFTGGVSWVLSALIGAGIQTGVDTIETLILGETVSLKQTALELGHNFALTFVGNWIGATMIPINAGWFKPQKFFSVFTGSYGKKILTQTTIGAGFSGTINFIRKVDWEKIDWEKIAPVIPTPIIPIHPYFLR